MADLQKPLEGLSRIKVSKIIQVRGIWNYVSYSMFLCLVFSETDHKIFKFSMFSRELPFSHIAYQFTVQVRE